MKAGTSIFIGAGAGAGAGAGFAAGAGMGAGAWACTRFWHDTVNMKAGMTNINASTIQNFFCMVLPPFDIGILGLMAIS
jgi:hypothetical protein